MIEPAQKEAAFSLDCLVSGITDENQYNLVGWGAPSGKEVWLWSAGLFLTLVF